MRKFLQRTIPGLAALTVGLALVGPAAADSLEHQWRTACTRDALRHCMLQALSGDRDGVRDCLVAKLPRLSSACRGVINAAWAKRGPTPPPPNPQGSQRELLVR